MTDCMKMVTEVFLDKTALKRTQEVLACQDKINRQ